jgi:hypothetical protein
MGGSGNFAASSECASSQKAPFAAESLGFGGASATTTGNFAADLLQMQQTERRPPNRRLWRVAGGMRRFLIRAILIAGGALVLIAGLWYVTSRWCALVVDQVYTPHLAVLQNTPIGWNGTWLQLGTGVFDRLVPNGDHLNFIGVAPDYPDIARFIVDADGRLVFVKEDARFVLGPRAGTLPLSTMQDGTPLAGQTPMPAFAPASGDTVSAALDRSLFSWPAPLIQFNFMTGYTPSWQRNLYYRFSWAKPSGARLAILWRERQDYDAVNGWTGARLTELIRIEIRPVTGTPVVWVERER